MASTLDLIKDLPRGNDFPDRIQWTIRKSQQSGRPFFVIILQLENFKVYAERQPRYVVLTLMKEIFREVRRVVHPSQFVGSFQNGFGFVFDAVDCGQVDLIAKRLASVALHVIREGRYNDVRSRWTEIIANFLIPQRPVAVFPRVGWSIYPRDGMNATQILKRSLHHLAEVNR